MIPNVYSMSDCSALLQCRTITSGGKRILITAFICVKHRHKKHYTIVLLFDNLEPDYQMRW
jgi:hypothetical protein